MAKFQVALSNGKLEKFDGDDCSFHIADNGVLLVRAHGKDARFSPSAWVCVDTETPSESAFIA